MFIPDIKNKTLTVKNVYKLQYNFTDVGAIKFYFLKFCFLKRQCHKIFDQFFGLKDSA